MNLSELLGLLKNLGTSERTNAFADYGPTTCPNAPHVEKDLDFIVTQISDCVIISSEISPAGLINLVSHCWASVLKLMDKGVLCRGYITRGLIYHTENQVVGSGYQEAYSKESAVSAFKKNADECGTPFVEISPSVCKYVNSEGDDCVKEMFSRMVKSDGMTTALYPFKRIEYTLIIGGFGNDKFDENRELAELNNVRKILSNFKSKLLSVTDQNNPKAVSKTMHYITALDEQLRRCDLTEEIIRSLSEKL